MKLYLEKVYLLLTTRCNSDCRYCIVRKTDEDMSLATIHSGIDILFNSEGKNKKVAFYGGEPLLCFDLIEESVDYVYEKQAETGQQISLYIYTNGIDLTDQRIEYFQRNNIKAIFSFDACQQIMSEKKKTSNHKRTFTTRIENLKKLMDVVGPLNISGAAVLLPDEVDMLMPLVHYLIDELNLRVIKLLPGLVRYHWPDRQQRKLFNSLNRMILYFSSLMQEDKFVYLDSLNESFNRVRMKLSHDEIHISVIEIYPNGYFGLSPCEFETPPHVENVNDVDLYYLGTVAHAKTEDIISTYNQINFPKHGGLATMSQWCDREANRLIELAEHNKTVREYIDRAAKLTFA